MQADSQGKLLRTIAAGGMAFVLAASYPAYALGDEVDAGDDEQVVAVIASEMDDGEGFVFEDEELDGGLEDEGYEGDGELEDELEYDDEDLEYEDMDDEDLEYEDMDDEDLDEDESDDSDDEFEDDDEDEVDDSDGEEDMDDFEGDMDLGDDDMDDVELGDEEDSDDELDLDDEELDGEYDFDFDDEEDWYADDCYENAWDDIDEDLETNGMELIEVSSSSSFGYSAYAKILSLGKPKTLEIMDVATPLAAPEGLRARSQLAQVAARLRPLEATLHEAKLPVANGTGTIQKWVLDLRHMADGIFGVLGRLKRGCMLLQQTVQG